ncbi:MAG TPA: DUF1294 domain-containing protein [Cellvibrionaceae bacterium]|nr:DUF1294 domain-containing protein [Cellvibrionaceae bacterium]HNG60873.1 DUF1294 domain-containing protein [Cellvibrionaceae bacterium]
MSAIAYSLYAWDKRAAQASRWRISERNLHLVALLGGWPGAIFAQQRLRHKSQKLSFRVIFYSTVLINVALLIAYGWRQFWAF